MDCVLCSLYTYEGTPVTDGSRLESGQLYVAVGRERFKKLPYSDLLFTKPRGTKRVNGWICYQLFVENLCLVTHFDVAAICEMTSIISRRWSLHLTSQFRDMFWKFEATRTTTGGSWRLGPQVAFVMTPPGPISPKSPGTCPPSSTKQYFKGQADSTEGRNVFDVMDATYEFNLKIIF